VSPDDGWFSLSEDRLRRRGHSPTLLTVTLKAVAVALYVVAGLIALAGISRVAMIGKPRKPITRGDAIAGAVYCAILVIIVVIAAMRLG
jgi:hypothetical protein